MASLCPTGTGFAPPSAQPHWKKCLSSSSVRVTWSLFGGLLSCLKQPSIQVTMAIIITSMVNAIVVILRVRALSAAVCPKLHAGVSHLPSRQWQGVAVTAPCPPTVDAPAAPCGGLPMLNDATLEAKLAEMVSNPMITTIFRAHRQDARKSRHVLLCVTKPANILGLKRPPHPRQVFLLMPTLVL